MEFYWNPPQEANVVLKHISQFPYCIFIETQEEYTRNGGVALWECAFTELLTKNRRNRISTCQLIFTVYENEK